MADLVDILRIAPEIKKLRALDTGVIDRLHGLSSSIELEIGFDETDLRIGDGYSRLLEYKKGLEDFLIGFNAGYKPEKNTSELNSTYYDDGFTNGRQTQEVIEKAQKTGNIHVVASYERFAEQLQITILSLDSQIKELIEANRDSYDFLLKQMPVGDNKYNDVPESLVNILRQNQDLVKDLLFGKLDDKFVKELERKEEPTFEENVQLGIIYMFRNYIMGAHTHFDKAKKQGSKNPLYESVRNIASNTLAANNMIKYIYSRIQLAQEFERV